jgi:hypothetical protein
MLKRSAAARKEPSEGTGIAPTCNLRSQNTHRGYPAEWCMLDYDGGDANADCFTTEAANAADGRLINMRCPDSHRANRLVWSLQGLPLLVYLVVAVPSSPTSSAPTPLC